MSRRRICQLILFITAFILCGGYATGEGPGDNDTSFVFAGHIRGPRNFTINSLLPYFVEDAGSVHKDFVLIGGDCICGYKTAYDEEALDREWDMVDRYLGRLDVPVYRVPGNHDWHSIETKTVFNRRYGPEYFSFRKNNVLVIGLNSIKLCPDKTIDWAGIWGSDSHLPNEPELPGGEQWSFFKEALRIAIVDGGIEHVVIFMGDTAWQNPDTEKEWWGRIHPALAASGKVKLILSGEAGDDKKDVFLKKDGIIYIRSGWGITEEDGFSLKGTYLHVIFREGSGSPGIYTRFINLTPQVFQQFMSSIPLDTGRHIGSKLGMMNGLSFSPLNKARMFMRDAMNRNVKIYDRGWDVRAALALLVILLVFIFLAARNAMRRS